MMHYHLASFPRAPMTGYGNPDADRVNWMATNCLLNYLCFVQEGSLTLDEEYILSYVSHFYLSEEGNEPDANGHVPVSLRELEDTVMILAPAYLPMFQGYLATRYPTNQSLTGAYIVQQTQYVHTVVLEFIDNAIEAYVPQAGAMESEPMRFEYRYWVS